MAAAADHKEDWVAVQQKTFTKWVNNHLRKKGFSAMENVQTEFETGLKLGELVNALYNLPMPKFNQKPIIRAQKLDNISLALKMVDDAKIKTNFLKSNHLIDHDLKMLLGMIWAIILDFSIKGISVDEMTAKEGLLLWVQKKTKGYRDVDQPINNFTLSWKSGMAFAALIHKHFPQAIDYDSLDAKNHKENLETAFAAAEKLGIPRLLDVADLLVERPDERSVMTYVSEYFHRFAQQNLKEIAARRAAKFVQFARSVSQKKYAYEARVAELLAWIAAKQDEFKEAKFGETLDEAKAAQDKVKTYFVTDKPPKIAEKLDIESLFAEIQTELKVNDRAPYVPEAKYLPDALDAAWDGLTASEKTYASAIRDNRHRFIRKAEVKLSAEQVAEAKQSFMHFDQNHDNAMDRLEFKAANAAMSINFKDEKLFDATFAEVSGGTGSVNLDQYLAYMTRLQEDRDSADQVLAAFKSLANDDAEGVTAQQLAVPPLSEEDVKFLASAMPAKGDKLDYAAFVQANFAH